MGTVGQDLDLIQTRLHDAGQIWSRTELLDWYKDGLRQLLALSQAVRRFTVLDVPPRHTMSGTYPWEQRYTQGGTWRPWAYSAPGDFVQVTTLWELESLEGIAPTVHYGNVTHLWELVYAGETVDQHYTFAAPRNHERIAGIWYDHEALEPHNVKALDALEAHWYRQQGEPWLWTPGVGRNRTFDIYQIVTTYHQGYERDGEEDYGIPRHFSGERTYALDSESTDQGYAYTTDGDADAITRQASRFSAVSAYSLPGELGASYPDQAKLPAAHLPTYQWTLMASDPERTATQAWEIGAGTETGAHRGQWPWEAQHGATAVPADADSPVGVGILTGLGLRFTQDAVNGYHGSHVWEAELLTTPALLSGLEEPDTTPGVNVGTYVWEAGYGAAIVTFGVGALRGIESPDRQYLALETWDTPLGTIREWKSSVNSLLLWEVVVPDVPDLTEDDTPLILPGPMQKYLRYYTLFQAFNRQGEGYNGSIALIYEQRWLRGITFLRRLGNLIRRDVEYRREPVAVGEGRTPRPRLPGKYGRV